MKDINNKQKEVQVLNFFERYEKLFKKYNIYVNKDIYLGRLDNILFDMEEYNIHSITRSVYPTNVALS